MSCSVSASAPLTGYIDSIYLDIVVTHPTDGSAPLYGKMWKITGSSQWNLTGKIFVVLSDGRIINTKNSPIGRKQTETINEKPEKILHINSAKFLWGRANRPEKIQTERTLVGSDYHYRFSEEIAIKLTKFSPVMQFYLHRDDIGPFLKLTPHATDLTKQTITPSSDRAIPFDCLCLKEERLLIPGTKDKISQTVKLVFADFHWIE